MPTTSEGYRYPVLTDTANVPRDVGNLAADVNAGIVAVKAAWTAYTPTLTAATTAPNLGTGGKMYAAYKQVGKTVTVRFRVQFGTGFTAGSGYYILSLPVPSLAVTATTGTYGGKYGAIGIASAGEASGTLTAHTASLESTTTIIFQAGNNALLDHTGPRGVAWTATGYIGGTVTYEAA